jgi:hypothetical protein
MHKTHMMNFLEQVEQFMLRLFSEDINADNIHSFRVPNDEHDDPEKAEDSQFRKQGLEYRAHLRHGNNA